MKHLTFVKRKAKILKRDNRLKPNAFRVYFLKSNKHYYASLIDNNSGNVIFSVSTQSVSTLNKSSVERITDLAKVFSEKVSLGIYNGLYFDRGVYRFHGLVKHFVDKIRLEGVRV